MQQRSRIKLDTYGRTRICMNADTCEGLLMPHGATQGGFARVGYMTTCALCMAVCH